MCICICQYMCICIYVTCAHVWCYVARSFLHLHTHSGRYVVRSSLALWTWWQRSPERNGWISGETLVLEHKNRGRVITTIQNWHGIVVPERCYQNRGTVKGRRDVYVHDNVNSVCVYVYGTHVYLYIYSTYAYIYIFNYIHTYTDTYVHPLHMYIYTIYSCFKLYMHTHIDTYVHALHCIALHSIALHCIPLHCIALHAFTHTHMYIYIYLYTHRHVNWLWFCK